MILSGRDVSASVKEKVKEDCMKFSNRFGRKPTLAVVLVGDNPASITYVKGKRKACEEVGIDHIDLVLSDDTTQVQLLDLVYKLNSDASIDGILVQLPLPDQIDDMVIVNAICPEKDVDGFTPYNIGRLLLGEKTLVACTPKGILEILDYYKIDTSSKDVCILGRSNIVGKPLAALLMQKDRNATVTICHSLTPDLVPYVKRADILISAVGQVNVVTADMVKEGAVVIDVGMNRVKDNSKISGYALKGDVDFDAIKDKVAGITPVPGGVGPMTIAMLMDNTITAACSIKGIDRNSL